MDEKKPHKGLIGLFNNATDRQIILFFLTCTIVGLVIFVGVIILTMLP